MRVRPAVAAALAAAAAVVPAASGASRDQIVDMRGDARGGLAHSDILRARWSTAGSGPTKSLVATMTLAAPPKKDVPFVYELRSEVRGCGTVWFQYTPGTVADATAQLNQPAINDGDVGYRVWIECGNGQAGPDGSSLLYKQLTFTIKDGTISWSVPLAALPESIGVGSVFSDFRAVADAGEPVLGTSVLGIGDQPLDLGRGDGVWILR